MEEKQYHLLMAGAVVLLLLGITLSSYFFPSKTTDVDSELAAGSQNNNNVAEAEKKAVALDLTTEEENNEKYTIKLIKPQKLPSDVQIVIDNKYKEVRASFLSKIKDLSLPENQAKYSLESVEPKIYESEDYNSIVLEFHETIESANPNQIFASVSYDKSSEKVATIEDVLENTNSNNEIYKYLSTYFQTIIANKLFEQTEAEKLTGEYKESLKNSVAIGLNPLPENFSIWYLNGGSIFFIFPSEKVAPASYGKQEASIYLNFIKSTLKNEGNE